MRGAPGHVHLGAIDPRPVYGISKRNSGVRPPLIGHGTTRDRFVTVPVLGGPGPRVRQRLLGENLLKETSDTMIVLGLILLLIGIFAKISILTTIGIILVVVGAVLFLLGASGRAIGGRKHWY